MKISPPSLTIDDVRAAAARIAGEVGETPCLASRTLSQICGCAVFLKFENLQFTASFKERGALNKMAQLTAAERAKGVLAVSAGNHAQAVAYHAQRMGIAATIVMPRFASSVKVENTRGFGAEVVLVGDTFEDARVAGLKLAEERGYTVVHPFDDLAVIAGQGTVALEMLAEQPDDRHPGRRHRRRRPDRRHGDGGEGAPPRPARRRRPDRALPGGVERDPRRQSRKPPGDDRRRHRRQVARGADAAGHPRPRRRRRPGLGRRHRAGDPDAARDREDGRRRRRRGRPRGADEGAGALRRQEGGPRPLRRQHRAAGAGRDHRARHGQVGPARPPARRRPRRPRRARRRRRAARPPRRQHRRGPAPARLHLALGRAGPDRGRRADARRRARRRRSSRRCAPRATTPSASADRSPPPPNIQMHRRQLLLAPASLLLARDPAHGRHPIARLIVRARGGQRGGARAGDGRGTGDVGAHRARLPGADRGDRPERAAPAQRHRAQSRRRSRSPRRSTASARPAGCAGRCTACRCWSRTTSRPATA